MVPFLKLFRAVWDSDGVWCLDSPEKLVLSLKGSCWDGDDAEKDRVSMYLNLRYLSLVNVARKSS